MTVVFPQCEGLIETEYGQEPYCPVCTVNISTAAATVVASFVELED